MNTKPETLGQSGRVRVQKKTHLGQVQTNTSAQPNTHTQTQLTHSHTSISLSHPNSSHNYKQTLQHSPNTQLQTLVTHSHSSIHHTSTNKYLSHTPTVKVLIWLCHPNSQFIIWQWQPNPPFNNLPVAVKSHHCSKSIWQQSNPPFNNPHFKIIWLAQSNPHLVVPSNLSVHNLAVASK